MQAIQNISALGNISELTTPTAAQVYPLGTVISVVDNDVKSIKLYMYVKAHAALTQYQPYLVKQSATSGAEFVTAAAVTLASAVSLVCVPQVAFTANYYGFVLIQGRGTSLITQPSVAGGFMYLATSGTTLLSDSTSAATINSCAVSITATTGASVAVNLLGYPCEIKTT